jgi:NAD(P)-dependent dehydrogenase (short-subunit alcohol dehydrogenase family)
MSFDRSCVVTGAAAGIGRAIAAHLERGGWYVVGVDVADAPDPGGSDSGKPDSAGRPGYRHVLGDVAEPETSRLAGEIADAQAPLRGWVNNAGIEIPEAAGDVTAAAARRQVDVNLMGTVWGCAEAARRMTAHGRGGAVVNLSSIQAEQTMPGAFVYAATKAAVAALARQLAVEYAQAGIRANSVCPGAIMTPMNAGFFDASDDPDAARAHESWLSPMGRMGTVDEVAAAVVWLLSDDASYVSGTSLGIDGAAAAWLTSQPPLSP